MLGDCGTRDGRQDSAAAAKVGSLLAVLQSTAARAWRSGWVTLLSATVQKTLATTLVDTGPAALDAADGGELAVTLDFYRLPMAFAIYDSTANLSR